MTDNPADWGAAPVDEGPASWGAVSADAPMTAGETVWDVAKSGGIGLAKGAIGLLGMPGDIGELGAKGIDWATQKVGGALGMDLSRQKQEPLLPLPGSADIQHGIESVTGKFYEPKSTLGKYAETAGEFAPAVIGGPEGIGSRLISRVGLPAFTSETAGEIAHNIAPNNPEAEGWARLVGGVGAGVFGVPKRASYSAPSIERLFDAARQDYQHPDVTNLRLSVPALERLSDSIWSDLYARSFRQPDAPRVHGILQDMKVPLNAAGNPASEAAIADIQTARKRLGRVAGEFANPTEQEAARHAIRGIDDYFKSGVPAGDVISGDAAAAARRLSDATKNWSAAEHGQTIAESLTAAERRAASTYSGGNLDNAIRQNIRRILDNPKRRRGYTPEQIEQMDRIVEGTKIGNAARKWSRIGGGGGGLGTVMASEAGAHMLGPAGRVGIPLVGHGLRAVGEASTSRQAEKLNQMVRQTSPEGARQQALYNTLNPNPPMGARSAALGRSAIYAEPQLQLMGPPDAPYYVPVRANGGRVWHPAQAGAKKARDGNWYAKDPSRPGKYLRVARGSKASPV